ncbi:MAG: hypothetical protein AABN34_20495 [Acidobacteriota bacterium]
MTMMAIIETYFLNDSRVASAAHSMIALDVMVKLYLTHLSDASRSGYWSLVIMSFAI